MRNVSVSNKGMRFLMQTFRFILVGAIATGLHYLIYWILLRWINASVAYTIGYIVSFCINYLLTTLFTFKKGFTIKNGFGFCAAHLINYAIHIVLLNIVLWMGVSDVWAPVPVFCIAIPVNYLLLTRIYK